MTSNDLQYQEIGQPLVENPFRVMKQQNMYVAVSYKTGGPTFGMAKIDNGVVKCRFSNLAGVWCEDKDGVKILVDDKNHKKRNFWYNWVKFKDRNSEGNREVFMVDGVSPILALDHEEGPLLGHLDRQFAYFSTETEIVNKNGEAAIAECWIIVREFDGAPPSCYCPDCAKEPPKKIARFMHDEWIDKRAGDPWPEEKLVRVLDRSLNTLPNEKPDQYVALWYQQGEPVIGHIWNEGGKIAANFSWNGHEYRDKIGSLQILVELPQSITGFTYEWVDVLKAKKFYEAFWVRIENKKKHLLAAITKINDEDRICGVENIDENVKLVLCRTYEFATVTHAINEASGADNFNCPFCERPYKRARNLSNHIIDIHPHVLAPLVVGLCAEDGVAVLVQKSSRCRVKEIKFSAKCFVVGIGSESLFQQLTVNDLDNHKDLYSWLRTIETTIQQRNCLPNITLLVADTENWIHEFTNHGHHRKHYVSIGHHCEKVDVAFNTSAETETTVENASLKLFNVIQSLGIDELTASDVEVYEFTKESTKKIEK
uniref:C2H2-type domain-containing protein n=1 Tax=Panagrolaimus sp. JU765 TaxID=591449 RepID=A0AC34RGR2_9BILA